MPSKKTIEKQKGIEKARKLVGLKKPKSYADYLKELSSREGQNYDKQLQKFKANKKNVSKFDSF